MAQVNVGPLPSLFWNSVQAELGLIVSQFSFLSTWTTVMYHYTQLKTKDFFRCSILTLTPLGMYQKFTRIIFLPEDTWTWVRMDKNGNKLPNNSFQKWDYHIKKLFISSKSVFLKNKKQKTLWILGEFHIRTPNPTHLPIPSHMPSTLATSLPKENKHSDL